MQRMFTFLTSVLAALSFGMPVALAQDIPNASVDPIAGIGITAPDQVRVEHAFIATAAKGVTGTGNMRWEFGDGGTADGAVVTHAYTKSGRYTLTLTFTPTSGGTKVIATREMTAYLRAALLFTSQSEHNADEELLALANDEGIALTIIPVLGHSSILLQQNLVSELSVRQDAVLDADRLFFATPADSTLSALSSLAGKTAEMFLGKMVVIVADGRAGTLSRLARIVNGQLGTERIVLVQRASLRTLLQVADGRAALLELDEQDASPLVIDRKTPGPPAWALLSRLVDYSLGLRVPAATILLMLLVPLMIAVISFLRQVVGISTMGLYLPLTMALTYVFVGLPVGLGLTVFVIATGIALRWMLRRVHMLYMGRIGIATSVIVLLLLLVTLFVARFTPDALANLSILPMLLLAFITERTYGVIAERGLKPALLVLLETTVVATLAAVAVTEWEAMRTFIFAWPETTVLFIVAQVFISRYTGLRATELLRFRDLLNEVEYAEEE